MTTANVVEHLSGSDESLDQGVDAFLHAALPHNAVIPHPARVS